MSNGYVCIASRSLRLITNGEHFVWLLHHKIQELRYREKARDLIKCKGKSFFSPSSATIKSDELFIKRTGIFNSFDDERFAIGRTIRCRYYWPEATDSSLCAGVLGEYAFPVKRKDSGKEARSIKLRWNERSRQNAPIIRLTSGSLGSPQVEKRNETGDVTINRELVPPELFAPPQGKEKQKQVRGLHPWLTTTTVMHS